jgi:peptidylprolyl isomerase
MATSKQARHRQERAKDRLARSQAVREAKKRRQRIIAGIVSALIVVGLIAAIFAIAGDQDSVSVAPTTPTTPPVCVARTGDLPKGAPDVPVEVGPRPTALVKKDLKKGTGKEVKEGDTVKVNYIGVACKTGKIFDSSYKSGEPVEFPLSNVIPGWQQGIPGAKVGGRRLLGIPGDLAYGAQGSPPDIGPNETLWFVVDVLDTKATPASTSAPSTVPSTVTVPVSPTT